MRSICLVPGACGDCPVEYCFELSNPRFRSERIPHRCATVRTVESARIEHRYCRAAEAFRQMLRAVSCFSDAPGCVALLRWQCNPGSLLHAGDGRPESAGMCRGPVERKCELVYSRGFNFCRNAKVTNRDDALPWALELSDGSKCTLMTGGTYMMAGMRANYGCTGGDRTLFGDIDRSQPVWRIFSHTDKSIAMTQSTITVAWY